MLRIFLIMMASIGTFGVMATSSLIAREQAKTDEALESIKQQLTDQMGKDFDPSWVAVREEAPEIRGWITTPLDAPNKQQRLSQGKDIYFKTVESGFDGEMVIDVGGGLKVHGVSPKLAQTGGGGGKWPYASVTKQFIAAALIAELEMTEFTLDTKVSQFVPAIGKSQQVPTLRQLLQHRSGLRNPNETPVGPNGWPEFYNKPAEYGLDWCLKDRNAPPKEGWSYNNCDYIVLGAVFDELSYASVTEIVGSRVHKIEGDDMIPLGKRFINNENVDDFFAMREPESSVLPAYGASGSLGGPLSVISSFNRKTMKSFKEPDGPMKDFWNGDPKLGGMALGHWVFDVEHPACDAPITISQRKGEIGQYRLENIMLPQVNRSIVFATIDPTFDFGEIWTGSGFLYDAVGALACGDMS